jgi:hypothetical protein
MLLIVGHFFGGVTVVPSTRCVPDGGVWSMSVLSILVFPGVVTCWLVLAFPLMVLGLVSFFKGGATGPPGVTAPCGIFVVPIGRLCWVCGVTGTVACGVTVVLGLLGLGCVGFTGLPLRLVCAWMATLPKTIIRIRIFFMSFFYGLILPSIESSKVSPTTAPYARLIMPTAMPFLVSQ